MTRDVIVVSPELSLEAAWAIMSSGRVRHLPVVRARALIGMLSDRDVLVHARLQEDKSLQFPDNLLVVDAMSPTPLETCDSSTSVSEIAEVMIQKKIDAIPVVRGLHLVGLVTSTDLLRLLTEREDARLLPFEFRLIQDGKFYATAADA